MLDLTLSTTAAATILAGLSGVYVLSRDAGRRARAWRLLRLLLRRQI